MRVTEKGQITIPKSLRDALGIGAGSEVSFEVQRGGAALIVRKIADGPTRGEQLAQRLRGRGDIAMTTDEIMALTRAD
jgi:antitoxin PrlF